MDLRTGQGRTGSPSTYSQLQGQRLSSAVIVEEFGKTRLAAELFSGKRLIRRSSPGQLQSGFSQSAGVALIRRGIDGPLQLVEMRGSSETHSQARMSIASQFLAIS